MVRRGFVVAIVIRSTIYTYELGWMKDMVVIRQISSKLRNDMTLHTIQAVPQWVVVVVVVQYYMLRNIPDF